ncbi:MAG: CdaR family protein [Candidatus Binatia bacterium]
MLITPNRILKVGKRILRAFSLWWSGKGPKALIVHNGTLKLFSLAFASGLWLLVNAGERDAEKTLVVPVELRNLSPQLIIVGPRLDYVDLRVSGPRTLLGRLNSKKVTLDLAGVRPGPASFRLGADRLNLPRGVKLMRISPSQINLEIARSVKRIVPVRLDLMGKSPHGYELKEIVVEPDTVEVSGPAPRVEKLEAVMTEPVDMTRVTQPITQTLNLRGPEEELVSYNLEQVRARIDVHEVVQTRELRRVKITIKNTDAAVRAVTTPLQVDVTVRGPQRLVEKLQLSDGAVFVDAGGLEPGSGPVTLPVNVIVQPGIEVVSQEPAEVTLRLLADGKKPSQSPKKTSRGKKKSGV